MSEQASSELGIVRWYSLAKGYGFIRRGDQSPSDEDAEDVFVHHSEVTDEPLIEGERVRFDVADGPKGLNARNVRRMPASQAVDPEATAPE